MLQSVKPRKWVVVLYLLIPVALFIFSVFVPLMTALYFSFFEWKNGQSIYTATFNGLTNYRQLIADPIFWQSFGNNIYLVVACIIGQIGLAFVLVLFANSKLAVGKAVHRTFGFFPSTISAVCIGMIWSMVYHNKYGILNWFIINVLGKPEWAQVWLNDSAHVMLYVSIPLIWQYIGYYMVIMFSAIAGIDKVLAIRRQGIIALGGRIGFRSRIAGTIP